jgi:hypothetical protein|tara:strand:+ start:528 stop:830 length:303 start_codon:yes stop_codon:yes gene_type:complete
MIVIKKIIFISLSFLFLNGCVQSSAFLAPAITVASTGNVYQAGFQYGTNRALKKETGKGAAEHISEILNRPRKKSINKDFVTLVENRIKKTRKIIFSKKD